jgi:hypothetical protein
MFLIIGILGGYEAAQQVYESTGNFPAAAITFAAIACGGALATF